MKWTIPLSKMSSFAQVSSLTPRQRPRFYHCTHIHVHDSQFYVKIFINVHFMEIIGKMNLDQKRVVFFGLEWPIMLFVTALLDMNTECGREIRVTEKAPPVAKFVLNMLLFWKSRVMFSTTVNDLGCTQIINIHVILFETKMVTSGLVFKFYFWLVSQS